MRIETLLSLVVACSVMAATVSAADLWTGSSGGFTVQWKTSDITVSPHDRPGELVLSLRKEAVRKWAEISRDSAGQRLESSVSVRILSLVGPVLSVQEENNCDCGGAHPTASTRFRAIDLSRSRLGKAAPFLLTDAVAPPDVLAALSADKLVKQALAASRAHPPASLPQLLKAVAFQAIEIGDCSFAFGGDTLSSFAFFDAGTKDAAVRFSLSHAVEVCRGQIVQAGIRVPVLDRWQQALNKAKQRTEGFLMNDASKMAPKGAGTEFEFTK